MFVVICLKNFETKELRTKRLILRKFTLDDAKDMFITMEMIAIHQST